MKKTFLFCLLFILFIYSSIYALEKNVASQIWTVFCFDLTDNTAKTYDAANITATVYIDGVANAVDDSSPVETAGGYYLLDITAAESNGDHITLHPTSSSGNIQCIGCPMALWTRPTDFPDLNISSGIVEANIKQVGDDAIQDNNDGRLEVNVEEVGDSAISETVAGHLDVNVTYWEDDAVPATTDGYPAVNVEEWNDTDVPADVQAGYPTTIIKDGTGSGEIDTDSGTVLLRSATETQIDNIETDTAAQDTSTELRTLLTGSDTAVSTVTTSQVNTEVDNALDTAIPATPTDGSINSKIKRLRR